MAAGEDQAEAIVVDLFIPNLFVPAGRIVDARLHVSEKVSLRSIETRAPAQRVDRFEACR